MPLPRKFNRVITVHVTRRADPTHTASIRTRFDSEVRRRFRKALDKLESRLVEIIGGTPIQPVTNDAGERYVFERSSDKVTEFMRWLNRQVRAGVLGVSEGADLKRAAESAWSNVYIDTAYQRAIRQAGQNLKRGGAKVSESWITEAFNRPVHADRVGLIYTRTFEELIDVTEVMARQISDVLAAGMAEGRNPLDIARDLRDRVDKVGITRARLIARTEVIAAHADATLNSYQEAGVEGVEVEAEWSTAGDSRVCPACQANEGRLFTIQEARGMIPLHPNCRCAFLPRLVAGTGIELNWKRHAPRHHQAERRRRASAGAVPGANAHGHPCDHHRGGGTQQVAGHR